MEKLINFYKSLGSVIGDDGTVLQFKTDEIKQYSAVRTGIGIFDFSNSGVFSVAGDGAIDYLNSLLPKDIQFLEYNHIMYTTILAENGTIIDLIYIFRMIDKFLIVCSTSQKQKVFSLFKKYANENVILENKNDHYAIISLEGVYSWEVAKEIAGIDIIGLRYLSFFDTSYKDISEIYCARCGITGEYGFRFLLPVKDAVNFINYLMNIKTEHSMEFCGRELLSALSQEIRFPVFGIGIYEGDNPIEKGLNWMIDFRKENYLGKEFIEKSIGNPEMRKMVGFYCEEKVDDIKPHDKVYIDDSEIGEVVMQAYSYKLEKTIGYVLLKKEWASVGIDAYKIKANSKEFTIKTASTAFFLTESIRVQMV
ncbi:MAG: aminomethyltransferase family protein [Spirochaetales bacterium]|nr:aminomethyltransferase family protein [Spirochaetales bacterium]